MPGTMEDAKGWLLFFADSTSLSQCRPCLQGTQAESESKGSINNDTRQFCRAAKGYYSFGITGGTVLAVVRFPRGAQGAARHGVCSGLAAALCGGLCGTPVQTAAAGPDQKDSARPAAQRTRFMQEKRKKAEKCVAKQAHNII